MDSATDNPESSVHEIHVRELKALEAHKERIISIIIRTICGLRGHPLTLSLQRMNTYVLFYMVIAHTYVLLYMVTTSHFCSIGDNILNVLCSFQMYRRMI